MREVASRDALLRVGLALNFILLLVSPLGSLLGLWSLLFADDKTEMLFSVWLILQPVLHVVGHTKGWANYGVDNIKTAWSVAIPTISFVSLLLSIWILYW